MPDSSVCQASSAADLQSPLPLGSPAPDFVIASPTGGALRRLSDFRPNPIILSFQPSPWDPSHREEVALFNRLLSHLPGSGEPLVSMTVDGVWCHLRFDQSDLRLPLLSQPSLEGDIARAYGVAGANAVFVIDGDGIIRWRLVSPLGQQPPLAEILKALETLAPVLESQESRGIWSRRDFVAATLAATVALAARPATVNAASSPATTAAADVTTMPVTLKVNGRDLALQLDSRVTLLDALREYAGLSGTKKGCDHGQCGACTVHIDGRRVVSCLTFAAMHQGQAITTIEGLGNGDQLDPMQAAFLEYDGFQCGYCTPGQIMSATALLHEPCGSADDDVREAMSGNICRCGAYPNIVTAVQKVRGNAAPVSP